MRQMKNPLILAFAIIGVCAVLYGGLDNLPAPHARKKTRNGYGPPRRKHPALVTYLKQAPPPPQR